MVMRFRLLRLSARVRWVAFAALLLAVHTQAQAAAPAAARRLQLTFTGQAAFDQFGFSGDGAGDFNGDGFADVIVGAYQHSPGISVAGRAYIYFGGPTADAVADLILNGVASGDNFAYSVAGAGDVNGDGYADVIVGAIGSDGNGVDSGRAYVFFGGSAPNAVADMTLTGVNANDFFGQDRKST